MALWLFSLLIGIIKFAAGAPPILTDEPSSVCGDSLGQRDSFDSIGSPLSSFSFDKSDYISGSNEEIPLLDFTIRYIKSCSKADYQITESNPNTSSDSLDGKDDDGDLSTGIPLCRFPTIDNERSKSSSAYADFLNEDDEDDDGDYFGIPLRRYPTNDVPSSPSFSFDKSSLGLSSSYEGVPHFLDLITIGYKGKLEEECQLIGIDLNPSTLFSVSVSVRSPNISCMKRMYEGKFPFDTVLIDLDEAGADYLDFDWWNNISILHAQILSSSSIDMGVRVQINITSFAGKKDLLSRLLELMDLSPPLFPISVILDGLESWENGIAGWLSILETPTLASSLQYISEISVSAINFTIHGVQLFSQTVGKMQKLKSFHLISCTFPQNASLWTLFAGLPIMPEINAINVTDTLVNDDDALNLAVNLTLKNIFPELESLTLLGTRNMTHGGISNIFRGLRETLIREIDLTGAMDGLVQKNAESSDLGLVDRWELEQVVTLISDDLQSLPYLSTLKLPGQIFYYYCKPIKANRLHIEFRQSFLEWMKREMFRVSFFIDDKGSHLFKPIPIVQKEMLDLALESEGLESMSLHQMILRYRFEKSLRAGELIFNANES